jgi:hypothetical protein
LLSGNGTHHRPMPELVDGLTLSALIAGTLEYALLMRHRELRRYELRLDESIAEAGLRALVRVVLIDDQLPARPKRRLPRLRRPVRIRGRSAAQRAHQADPALRT